MKFHDPESGQDFVADISQNTSARMQCGSILPACCTSSVCLSFSQQRFFTPPDLQLSQGWPLPSCLVFGDFAHIGVSQHVQRRVVGNGQHLMQVGQVFLYMSCFSMRRGAVVKMIPVPHQLPLPAGDGSDVEVEQVRFVVSRCALGRWSQLQEARGTKRRMHQQQQ